MEWKTDSNTGRGAYEFADLRKYETLDQNTKTFYYKQEDFGLDLT